MPHVNVRLIEGGFAIRSGSFGERSRLTVYRGMGHAVHWQGPRRSAGELVAFTKLVMET